MAKTVLLTGANGFVGSHIADALLREGYTLHAMVRATSNLQWLEEKPVALVYGSLQDRTSLRNAVRDVDVVIHNAGVVSTESRYHYYLFNSDSTRTLLEIIKEENPNLSRFVYVSSQAACGPTESGIFRYEDDPPNPITAYGHSKLLAEKHVSKYRDDFPVTIVRPPAVYGPRDVAWLSYFKMISDGWMPLLGQFRELSLTHAQDLARQVLLQVENEKAINEAFFCSPFEPVSMEEFADTISCILSANPKTIHIPDAVIKYGAAAVFPVLGTLGVKTPFKRDKLPDMLASRWTVSGEKAKEVLGFEGKMPLRAGIGQTAEWYRWKNWIKTDRDRLKEEGKNTINWVSQDGKMRKFDRCCDLCALTYEHEVKTKKHYEDDDFIIVDCLICQVPMAVLKEHRPSFTEEEKQRLLKIFADMFGEDQHPDFHQRRIPEHAHVHYRADLHLKPWERRPE